MNIKRSYYEDIELLGSGAKKFWFAVLAACLIALPFIIPGYYINDINYIAINIIVAVGLNILVGYTGQVSIGHAGFFAIGAYGTALVMKYAPAVPFTSCPVSYVAVPLIVTWEKGSTEDELN